MTTPSSFSGQGLSIQVYTPRAWAAKTFLYNISDDINSYTHTISTDGGFTSASFQMSGNQSFIEDWYQSGLGRHIQVFGPSFNLVWEGFVNDVSITAGGLTASRGPLTELANRVQVNYAPVIVDENGVPVDPPVTGTTTSTLLDAGSMNGDSIAIYGTWEKVVNSGNLSDADAIYIRDLFLEENAWPRGSNSLSVGADSGTLEVTINCRGYIDWFSYIYNDVTEQYITCTDKIISVIAADPNNIVSSVTERIANNAYAIMALDDTDRTAKTVIDEIVSLGGGSDARWAFGIYGWQIPRYEPVSTSIDYFFYMADGVQRVETDRGTVLQAWDVIPGKWVAMPEFVWGSSVRSFDIRTDPRVFFVEEVVFTAPDQVVLSGGNKIYKMGQYLAKLGLGGG